MTLEAGFKAFMTERLPAVHVHPLRLPHTPLLPAITYRVIDTVPSPSHGGPSGLLTPRIQLDCYADTHEAAVALGAAVRGHLDGFVGTWGDTIIRPCLLEDERDIDEPNVKLWRRMLDFRITYRLVVGS